MPTLHITTLLTDTVTTEVLPRVPPHNRSTATCLPPPITTGSCDRERQGGKYFLGTLLTGVGLGVYPGVVALVVGQLVVQLRGVGWQRVLACVGIWVVSEGERNSSLSTCSQRSYNYTTSNIPTIPLYDPLTTN